jgi:hypothetical protein
LVDSSAELSFTLPGICASFAGGGVREKPRKK